MKNKTELFDTYSITEITEGDFRAFSQEHGLGLFEDLLSFSVNRLLTDDEKDAKKLLGDSLGTPRSLYWGIYQDSSLIGWSFGKQESSERFYMVSTAILPEHQGKGIYTALIPAILARVKECGYQVVYSRHRATHNAVIIPKLKAGFQITSMELSDQYGPLIHLSYYFNESRRELLEFRSGRRLSEDRMKYYLGIDSEDN